VVRVRVRVTWSIKIQSQGPESSPGSESEFRRIQRANSLNSVKSESHKSQVRVKSDKSESGSESRVKFSGQEVRVKSGSRSQGPSRIKVRVRSGSSQVQVISPSQVKSKLSQVKSSQVRVRSEWGGWGWGLGWGLVWVDLPLQCGGDGSVVAVSDARPLCSKKEEERRKAVISSFEGVKRRQSASSRV
jgi:hypothetical protein